MKRHLIVAALTLFGASVAIASPACESAADQKKLSGAARTSFLGKCERESKVVQTCDAQATEKKLSGAARTSWSKRSAANGSAAK
jgi:hypothetical protein